MINNNLKKIILLLSLCFLLIGIVSATSTNDTTTKTSNMIKEEKNVDTSIAKTNIINKNVNKEVKKAPKKNNTKLSISLNQSKAILNDKVKVTVTLKDNKNKPIKNQNISVKIGTKIYTKVTNKNGKIVLNYKITDNNVLGKNITAKYKGNTVYISSKATKLLKSNEATIYNKKMKQIATYIDKIEKLEDAIDMVEDRLDDGHISFNTAYKQINSYISSSINYLNKAITTSNDLYKYLTDKNRKTFINLNKNELKTAKSIMLETQKIFKQTKLFVDGKISEKTFYSRLFSLDNKIENYDDALDIIEFKIKNLYLKYPSLIKGVEKYFID
ncbi:MAG: Ig-like domain-containing protein [Methanosphaera sp.]|nr:Ig-like domain-containing protein [Methanosphaera sp.]